MQAGQLIRLARNKRGISQSQLADEIGTSQRWVSEIENGKSRAELGKVIRCMRIAGIELEGRIKEK